MVGIVSPCTWFGALSSGSRCFSGRKRQSLWSRPARRMRRRAMVGRNRSSGAAGLPTVCKWRSPPTAHRLIGWGRLTRGSVCASPSMSSSSTKEQRRCAGSAQLVQLRQGGLPVRMGHSTVIEPIGRQAYSQIPRGWDDALSDDRSSSATITAGSSARQGPRGFLHRCVQPRRGGPVPVARSSLCFLRQGQG